MTTEELLLPRIKCIAGNPFNTIFYKGLIITLVGADNYFTDDPDTLLYKEFDFNKYPHLFKEIKNWWEDRKKSDLPKYVKLYDGKILPIDKETKITSDDIGYPTKSGDYRWRSLYKSQPSTHEEYQNYIKS